MSRFTDRAGREWDLSLNMGMISRIRKANNINLGNILGNQKELIRLIYDDLDLLGQVLYGLLEPQIKKFNIDADEFAEAFDGRTLQAARDALAVAITNFSLPPQAATAASESLKKVMGATDEMTAAMIGMETDKAISTLSNTVTNSPASAA